jgi:hypothetical protein
LSVLTKKEEKMSLEHIDQHFAAACEALQRADTPVIKSIARHDAKEVRHMAASDITPEMKETILSLGTLAAESASVTDWYRHDQPNPQAA